MHVGMRAQFYQSVGSHLPALRAAAGRQASASLSRRAGSGPVIAGHRVAAIEKGGRQEDRCRHAQFPQDGPGVAVDALVAVVEGDDERPLAAAARRASRLASSRRSGQAVKPRASSPRSCAANRSGGTFQVGGAAAAVAPGPTGATR